MDTSTIAAIATPIGSGGIGIIRISGPEALFIASSLFVAHRNEIRGKSPDFASHRLCIISFISFDAEKKVGLSE
ncbi:MAG: hypothetical protein R2941_04900 [Desulfobacterales bacterium]